MNLAGYSMDSTLKTSCHVVAVPYPGRGHVNPMLNLCKLLASKKHDVLITVVVTEEWYGFIGSDNRPTNMRLASIPNVIPSELVRGADFPGFYEAVMTNMESPFDRLLDQLDPSVTTIVADTELLWAIRIGNRRNIPVATLCTVPAKVFSVFHHFSHELNLQTLVNLLDHGDEHVQQSQGISSAHLAELRTVFHGSVRRVIQLTLECISLVPKAQYLLFNSVYELEPQVFDSLQEKFHLPIYPIGPAIPFFELDKDHSVSPSSPGYLRWLDSQPAGSVLYVSFGSFLSISREQMDEIAAGLRNSNVPYLWVAREETSRLQENCGDMGIVVPWCDQLKVLCHSSVGGFWTHCGWNSTLEAIASGVPMLAFPLIFDQVSNSKQIVENWRIGWKVRKDEGSETFVTKEEVTDLVRRLVDMENNDVKEMRRRAKELQDIARLALAEGGSSDKNLDAFISDICNLYS